jgi:mannan endo-1,4-beta-mannosidase
MEQTQNTDAASIGSVWFQSFPNGSEPEINTGANGLQRLDYVVRAAEKRGIRLLIPFVNNWNDYGGVKAYYQWCLGRSDESSITKANWYNNDKCQSQYRKYVKTVVSRYLNSPAIFAWELANEPRCSGCNVSVVTEWAKKSARYIKNLDPIHMVAVGDEGFGLKVTDKDSTSYPYQFDEGTDFASLLSIPDIDFGTFHLYPDHCKLP